jgi:acyl-CoA synthetase (NDP forming)
VSPEAGPRAGRLLEPRTIAIIGASSGEGLSSRLVANLAAHGFEGEIFLVNPRHSQIGGVPCYPSIVDVPASVDVAAVVVPADAVADALADCVQAGVGAAVIMAAGFVEDARGPGKDRQARIEEATRGSDLVVCGPNSEGFFNVSSGIALSFSGSVNPDFLRYSAAWMTPEEQNVREAIAGDVAIVAQSGGLGFSIFSRGVAAGMGFSHVISVGNEMDLDVLDCAEYLLTRAEVKVIGMYVEGLRHPERLPAVATAARRAGKAIVIGKSGVSAAGSRSTLSHTGHLAGDARLYAAAFRHYGIIEVSDQEELLDTCWALSTSPPLTGDNVAVVSWSGGSAVWTADACERAGFRLPVLDDDTQARLAELLPSFAGVQNPVDITGASKTSLGKIMRIVAEAPDADGLVLITTLHTEGAMERDFPDLSEALAATGKPMVVYSYTEPRPGNRRAVRDLGLPLYPSSTRAAKSLGALRALGRSREQGAAQDAVHAAAAPPAGGERPGVYTERQTTERLRSAGFAVAEHALATDAAAAVAAAARIGFPVALKLQAPSVPHKASIGGVLLNVGDADAVHAGFTRLWDDIASGIHDAEGILVQRMIPDGIEMLVGIDNTAGFGPMVMLGFGGSNVERVNDTVIEAAPLTTERALAMIGSLRNAAVLTEGLGGRHGYDIEALAGFLVRISAWAVAHRDTVGELDINPLLVTGSGVLIVDSLLVGVAAVSAA